MRNFLKNLLRDNPVKKADFTVPSDSVAVERRGIKLAPWEEYGPGGTIAVTSRTVRELYGPAKTFGGPKDEGKRIAQDAALEGAGFYPGLYGLIGEGLAYAAAPKFPGYAFLSGLTQNALIRAGVETVADEMTREWVTLKRAGTADKTQPEDGNPEPLEILRGEMDRFGLRDVFHQAAEMCGYFGGCLVYIDTGARGDDLKFPLIIDRATIGRGDLLRFVPVEPVNIYPGLYNSINPLAPDYFKPSIWWVLGQEVHESRFLYFVTNPPPMILKPVYNFLGISTAQLAYDYVLHFTEDREAASRLLNKFSLTILKTNMEAVLSGGGAEEITKRVKYMTQLRNNDGTLVVDKDMEDIIQINTPLGGVTDIVRQALELLAAVFRIPAVKLLGISPAGFNATGESDLRNYYDHVHSQQEKIFREPLKKALKLLQVNAGLEIDPAITFDFEPLGGEDETAINQRNLISAQTDVALIGAGVISAEESRKRLADNPTSGYDDIDPEDVPEDTGYDLPGDDPQPAADESGEYDWIFAADKDFDENRINRQKDGKFESGSGSSKSGEVDPFGVSYSKFSGDPEGAINKLLEEKGGYVPAAAYKEGIGDIDFVYGEAGEKGTGQGYGLAHIIRRRNEEGRDGEALVRELPEIIKEGKVVHNPDFSNRVYIENNNKTAAIRLNYNGEDRTWLVSAYIKRP